MTLALAIALAARLLAFGAANERLPELADRPVNDFAGVIDPRSTAAIDRDPRYERWRRVRMFLQLRAIKL